MAHIRITRGLDVDLAGRPAAEVVDAPATPLVTVYPQEFGDLKPRMKVREGDPVKRGSVLFVDKQNEAMKIRAPAGGTVRSIVLGERRTVTQIIIEGSGPEEAETFPRHSEEDILALDREEVLRILLDSGYLAYIRQRPFSGIARPDATPKSVFVNGMNSAPFQPDIHVVVRGDEAAFQAGLNAMTRLTSGKVNLCLAADPEQPSAAVTGARHVDVHTFGGPHPSGNTSVHIHHLDPVRPGDTVWTVNATDVILIGKLFLRGELPPTKVICVGGPGVEPTARKYYRVRIGASLLPILEGRLAEGELRVLAGDLLSGTAVPADSSVRFFESAVTVVPEGRERHFLGWLAPGMQRYSHSRLFLSRWFPRQGGWALNTSRNGSGRAMVLTGLYDRVMPMRIKTDFLIRAILAHDVEEAVKLGILETAPEDFALCSFICPSKMDLVGVAARGLAEVETEGL